jgi:hypothetical protein
MRESRQVPDGTDLEPADARVAGSAMKLPPESQRRQAIGSTAPAEVAARRGSPISARAGMLVLLVLLSPRDLTRTLALSGAPPDCPLPQKTPRWRHRSASADLSGA